MREYRADLHVHTVLSACAEVEMIPPLSVEEALRKGLDIIAITDHNTTGNALAVRAAAAETGLTVLLGMELQTREEVDLLCTSTRGGDAAWQSEADAQIPRCRTIPSVLGHNTSSIATATSWPKIRDCFRGQRSLGWRRQHDGYAHWGVWPYRPTSTARITA